MVLRLSAWGGEALSAPPLRSGCSRAAVAASIAPCSAARNAATMAQDAHQIRIGDRIYDIRTGSSDGGLVLSGPSSGGLEKVRQALSCWVPPP